MAKKLIVCGMIGNLPMGGAAWHYLHYLLGFRKLGYDVYYYEDTFGIPRMPAGAPAFYDERDQIYAVNYLYQVMEKFGFENKWCFKAFNTDRDYYGLEKAEISGIFDSAEAVVNIGGGYYLTEKKFSSPLLYINTDPVTLQILLTWRKETKATIDAQDKLWTFGESIGTKDSPCPTADYKWLHTRQPVVLSEFPFTYDPGAIYYTTVASWASGCNYLNYEGKKLEGSKRGQFMRFMDVPKILGGHFELALSTDKEEVIGMFEASKWKVVQPYDKTHSVDDYRDYLKRSRAEFSVEREVNIELKSGWFSERSACYLSLGKPVIVQDTGFDSIIPCGRGLFKFNSFEEIKEAHDIIEGDYKNQCRAARALAEEYFDSDKVLTKFLEEAGLPIRG